MNYLGIAHAGYEKTAAFINQINNICFTSKMCIRKRRNAKIQSILLADVAWQSNNKEYYSKKGKKTFEHLSLASTKKYKGKTVIPVKIWIIRVTYAIETHYNNPRVVKMLLSGA
ncbi:CLUMA_CG013887, isoform A [Clunio marinus]|uniref:CLUMA_CG013887, isoform A n=1 Tax=Clunio marinus TaxID=568069 RepID=A0A1J1IK66_9DIPT|nr:CLUMA_CG013887, isoform A [Clunio marinus]